jgi:hypothetical protein
LDHLEVSVLQGHLPGKVLVDVVSSLVFLLSEKFKSFLIVNKLHIVVVFLLLHLIQRAELGLHVEWILDLIRKEHLGDDDVAELESLGAEHLIEEIFHFLGIGLSFDLIDFKMSLSSDEHSNSLGQGGLELLIQLIDTDSVHEVTNGLLIILALEHDGDIHGDEDIIVGWAGSNRELVDDVLLSDQELDLGPWQAPDEATFLLDMVKLSVLGDNSIGSFGSVSKISIRKFHFGFTYTYTYGAQEDLSGIKTMGVSF